jgi:hypothetical protein
MISEKVGKRFNGRMRSYDLDFPHKPVIGEVEHRGKCGYEPSQALHCIPASRWYGAINPRIIFFS